MAYFPTSKNVIYITIIITNTYYQTGPIFGTRFSNKKCWINMKENCPSLRIKRFANVKTFFPRTLQNKSMVNLIK